MASGFMAALVAPGGRAQGPGGFGPLERLVLENCLH